MTEPQGPAHTPADLAAVLARGPVVLLCTDRELRYTWAVGAESLRSRVEGPLVGRTAFEVIGTTDPYHPLIRPLLDAVAGRESVYRAEFGDRVLENWSGPLRAPDGAVVGTGIVVVDVTDTARASGAERVARERLQRLVDHAPALIGLRDATDDVVLANSAYLRTFVRAQENAIARAPADDLTVLARQVRETLRSRAWEGRFRHPGGPPVDLRGFVFPLPAGDGEVGVGEVFLDVSGQERIRRKLVDAERRWRAVVDGVDAVIVLLDLVGRIVDANAAALRSAGSMRSDLLGRPGWVLIGRRDAAAVAPPWADLVAGRRSRFDSRVRLRQAGGRTVPAALSVTLLRDDAERPSGAVAVVAPAGRPVDPGPPAREPTPGELDVLVGLAAGRAIAEIGHDLELSRRGVDHRIRQLRRKLRDDDGNEPATAGALVARAYVLGLLEPGTWPPRPARA